MTGAPSGYLGPSRRCAPSLLTPAHLGRLLGTLPAPGQAIGLFGGSFDPPHAGHLALARSALRRLGLAQVWWLVAKDNPLKSAPEGQLAARHAAVGRLVSHERRFRVLCLDEFCTSPYTIHLCAQLHERLPRVRFVWLQGADGFLELPRWHRWRELFAQQPFAVFARPGFSRPALGSAPAQRHRRFRRPASQARRLAGCAPPAWTFFPETHSPLSSSQLRRTQAQQPQVSSQALAASAQTCLQDLKAEDIVTLDIAARSSFADYMIVAGGRSARHAQALAQHLEYKLKHLGCLLHVEGREQGEWLLIDAGDVIIHLFHSPELRAHYRLEQLWGGARPLSMPSDRE